MPMWTFFVRCRIENVTERSRSAILYRMVVDTDSEQTWVPSGVLERIGVTREKTDVPLVLTSGELVTRSMGSAIIRVGTAFTVDEVVFAERGDLHRLGARTLEGLNLCVDPRGQELVAADPPLSAAKF